MLYGREREMDTLGVRGKKVIEFVIACFPFFTVSFGFVVVFSFLYCCCDNKRRVCVL